MRHENTLIKNNDAVVKGSLAQVSKEKGQSLAESFIDADCIVIVDVSSSMEQQDAPGGKSRYQAACDELASLQSTMPGKIAILAFSNNCIFCPSGTPMNIGGMTNLAGALSFAKIADVPDMRFVIISDGEPDSPTEALRVAKGYKNHIDTIFVGPESHPYGRDFLAQLAKASGGKSVTADRVAQLSVKVQHLLAA